MLNFVQRAIRCLYIDGRLKCLAVNSHLKVILFLADKSIVCIAKVETFVSINAITQLSSMQLRF